MPWFPPRPEDQRCWLGWIRNGAAHVHRCGGSLEHPGLHTCTECGAIYIRRTRPQVAAKENDGV